MAGFHAGEALGLRDMRGLGWGLVTGEGFSRGGSRHEGFEKGGLGVGDSRDEGFWKGGFGVGDSRHEGFGERGEMSILMVSPLRVSISSCTYRL